MALLRHFAHYSQPYPIESKEESLRICVTLENLDYIEFIRMALETWLVQRHAPDLVYFFEHMELIRIGALAIYHYTAFFQRFYHLYGLWLDCGGWSWKRVRSSSWRLSLFWWRRGRRGFRTLFWKLF